VPRISPRTWAVYILSNIAGNIALIIPPFRTWIDLRKFETQRLEAAGEKHYVAEFIGCSRDAVANF
jgi:hypothetical protein